MTLPDFLFYRAAHLEHKNPQNLSSDHVLSQISVDQLSTHNHENAGKAAGQPEGNPSIDAHLDFS